MPNNNILSSSRPITGLVMNLTGKIASLVVLNDIHVSQDPKSRNVTTPATNGPMMTPLDHGYAAPPSCKAKRRGIGQQTERMPPTMSKPRIRSRLDLPSDRPGIEKKIRTEDVATIGPLVGLVCGRECMG